MLYSLLAQKKLLKAHAAFQIYVSDVKSKHPDWIVSTVPFHPVTTVPNERGPKEQIPVFVSSFANFTNLLLITVQRASADQFSLLRGEYRASLELDPYLYTVSIFIYKVIYICHS